MGRIRGGVFAQCPATAHSLAMAWPDREKSTFLGSSLTAVMGILWLGCGLPAAQAQLTTALEVRSLNAEAAEIGEAVDLTGIVIFSGDL